jgi:hypothetical protein
VARLHVGYRITFRDEEDAMSSTDPSNEREVLGDYSVDDENQLPASDTLEDTDAADDLDRGYSPPERYSRAQKYGTTPLEQELGESLDQRLEQEEPEADPYEQTPEDAILDDDLDDGEVGAQRAGRLVDPDLGTEEDTEKDLVGQDVGIDDASASAEEAAVHIVPEDESER